MYCGVGHYDRKGMLVVTQDDVDEVTAQYGTDSGETLPVRSSADAIARLPYGVTEDGIKELELTAEPVRWDYGNGHIIESWGYNGQLPGPEIRVSEGDTVRINFTHNLPVATTAHWHGVDLPNEMDGVPGYAQSPIEPGETFVCGFDAYPAGTRFYHTHGSHHGDEAEQMVIGLAGAFVIEPRNFDAIDLDYTMVLLNGFVTVCTPLTEQSTPKPNCRTALGSACRRRPQGGITYSRDGREHGAHAPSAGHSRTAARDRGACTGWTARYLDWGGRTFDGG